MKKITILILLILVLTSCTKEKDLKNTEQSKEDKPEITEPVEPAYIDNNPITVGLYQNGKLIKNLNTTITNMQDIASFDVYFTNEETLDSTNTKYNFNKYYSNYENIDKYKIGFYISFEADNKKQEMTILDPSSMHKLAPYIYNYLYDDVHQPDGAWYSHVEEDAVKEDTIYSSIKLFAADNGENITSPITLTVFTYDGSDDFDANNNYRGNSKYTITING